MSHIFISYASADRDRAKIFADILIAQGWSVWWDRAIPPGREFDEVIEEALDAASCVVVLWSKTSVASRWVKTEAAEAMRRKLLVPALIDDAKIPLEFRRLQAADLSQWRGEPDHPELQNFFQSLESHAPRTEKAAPAAPVSRPEAPPPSEQARLAPAAPVAPAAPAFSPSLSAGAHAPAAQRQGLSTTVVIVVGAVVVIAIAVTGYSVYRMQTATSVREMAAEAPRQVAVEGERKSEDKRRTADDAAAQAKAAQADAARESARRKAADEAAAMAARGRTTPAEPARPSIAVRTPDPATAPPSGDAVPGEINLSGMWRDATGGVHQIRQAGNRFEIVSTNPTNGYYAQSTGTVRGQQISTNFRSNLPSTGYATGIIAPDGRSISGTVNDSREGQYGLTIFR